MSTQAQVAKYLLDIKAIKLQPASPFTWASGMLSPIYCDNRLLLSYPAIRTSIVDIFADHIQSNYSCEMIAGVATAGIAHGALVANKLGLPFVYVRSKAKGHGRQNLIEGELTTKDNVVMIEDLISTGGSVIKAAEALKSEGVQVKGAAAIFTYGFEKAVQNFSEADLSFSTLSEYDTLLNVALEEKYITDSQKTILQEWRKDPKAWSDLRK